MRARTLVSAAAVTAALVLSGAPAWCQIVTGTLLDEGTGRPVEGAAVLLLDAEGVTRGGGRTDADGSWSLRAPARSGWFSIRVQKAGYATVETAPFQVGPAPVTLRLTTRPEIVLLEEVTAQRLAFGAFLSRRERRMGFGMGPDAVAQRMAWIQPRDTGRLLWGLLPGLEADPVTGTLSLPRRPGSRSGCAPTIIVDGRRYDNRPWGRPLDIDDLVPVWEIRAIEIYPDPWFVPGELRVRHTANLSCGVVVLWTYRAIGEH